MMLSSRPPDGAALSNDDPTRLIVECFGVDCLEFGLEPRSEKMGARLRRISDSCVRKCTIMCEDSVLPEPHSPAIIMHWSSL